MRKTLGTAWRGAKAFTSWALTELPKSPGLEVYGSIVDRDNRELTLRLREGGPEAFRSYITPYLSNYIPSLIWIYWAQGEIQAPSLVRRCIESWRRHNPDWDVRVLDRETVKKYVDLSKVSDELPIRLHGDYVRLKLLDAFGGVWTDATTICHRPLSEWLPLMGGQTGFFVFRSPHYDRWADSWFIAAHPGTALIRAWSKSFSEYLLKLQRPPTLYFAVIYALQWCLINDKDLRLAFRASGGLPAVPAFFLQAYLEGNSSAKPFLEAQAAGFPVSKLNWRLELPDDELHSRLDALGM